MPQGDDAPLDSHPDFIRREGTSHVNHGQRTPHSCKGVLKRGPAFFAVAECLADIAHAAAENVSHPSSSIIHHNV